MSLWEHLVSENPMLIEVRRYRRRMFGGGRPSGMNVAALTLGAVCYIGLLMVVGNGNGGIPPLVIVLIQTGVFTFAAPAMLNAAIAGEREKRTWDLLLAAPVTKAQIMIGKFAGAMTNLLIGAALFSLPVFICAVSYPRTQFGALLLGELDSLAFGMFVCALTLLFSARCRRGFTALGITLGFLVVALIVYPGLVSAFAYGPGGEFFFIFHPFVAIANLMSSEFGSNSGSLSGLTETLIQIPVFLGLTAVALVWTERTLTFTDNEVRFLPRHHARS